MIAIDVIQNESTVLIESSTVSYTVLVEDQADVLTREYALLAQESAAAALESENKAKTSEINSLTSENNAKESEIKALASENNSRVSEINAKESELIAVASAESAQTDKEEAEQILNEIKEVAIPRWSNTSW